MAVPTNSSNVRSNPPVNADTLLRKRAPGSIPRNLDDRTDNAGFVLIPDRSKAFQGLKSVDVARLTDEVLLLNKIYVGYVDTQTIDEKRAQAVYCFSVPDVDLWVTCLESVPVNVIAEGLLGRTSLTVTQPACNHYVPMMSKDLSRRYTINKP